MKMYHFSIFQIWSNLSSYKKFCLMSIDTVDPQVYKAFKFLLLDPNSHHKTDIQ
jgi:hypothetical protein